MRTVVGSVDSQDAEPTTRDASKANTARFTTLNLKTVRMVVVQKVGFVTWTE
jgi:hypothetical protein